MSGVCDDNFGAREIGPLFNLALQTKVNEIHSTKHMDMIYLEFVECLARVADKAIHHNTIDFPVEVVKDKRQSSQAAEKGVKLVKKSMKKAMFWMATPTKTNKEADEVDSSNDAKRSLIKTQAA